VALHNLLKRSEIATVLGVEQRTITNYQKLPKPIPTQRKGREVFYPLAPCVQWFAEYRVGEAEKSISELDMARQRKLTAEAELAEIKLAQERGGLVSVDVADRTLAGICDQLRARVLAFTGRVAPLVVGVPDVAEATALIEPVVHEFLGVLANETVVPAIADESSDDAAA
jgi:phage terminase Nu1 subunit (DNA packaging protein)